MNDTVYVTAIVHVNDSSIAEAIGILGELAEPTRAEDGCMAYGFYQDRHEPTVIQAFEEWRDADVFDAHLASPHFQSAIERLSPLLSQEPVIRQCQKII